MPTAFIPRIGEIDYISARLPEGIKGKAVIGGLKAPIQINEDLGPGAQLEYVLAHEVGHRLTLDMILNAYEESPSFFEYAPSPTAGFIRYLIHLGLQEGQMYPVHPATAANLKEIFAENFRGNYTPDDIAVEFIAEVYAGWATGKSNIPELIGKRFKMLTQSKNELLTVKRMQAAAFEDTAQVNAPMRERALREIQQARKWEYSGAVLGAIAAVVIFITLKEL